MNGDPDEIAAVSERLVSTGTEVLLYSLPTGRQRLAESYARAALDAGAAFVNCTPEKVARDDDLLKCFSDENLPLIGDDLASHLGATVVHRALLDLVTQRGLSLEGSYQVNLGGNEDFRNLRSHGSTKRESKLNAMRDSGIDVERVEVVPSGGHIGYIQDRKFCHINIESRGWGGTPAIIDLTLKVQDSSNAAGVIIDLVRIAAAGKRRGLGGALVASFPQLKSPPGGHRYTEDDLRVAYAELGP
nr:hypothetical protein [Kineosporia babensis]